MWSVFMMEIGSGNSGTTLKKIKINRRKNDIYLGDKERGGENEKQRNEKTKDPDVQNKEKGK
jgi:hypothetical protein